MSEDTSQEDTEQTAGWWSRHTSVATRLAIAVLIVSIIPVIVSVVVTVWTATSDGEELVQSRLEAVHGARSAELGGYAHSVDAAVRMLASSPMVVRGVQDFSEARAELNTIDPDELTGERAALAEFYLDEFLPALGAVRGESVDALEFAPGGGPAATYLQSNYIAENPLPVGEKYLLTDAEDGSAWTEVHKEIHPSLRATVDRLDFQNLMLVDAETRAIVYSARKDPAFATELDSGPYSGTPLAQLVEEVIAAGEPGIVRGADFAMYAPALDAPTAFIAAPVMEGEELVGVVVAGLSTDLINAVMSRDWQEGRRGESGELYLVGPDLRMRSDSRAFVESQSAYLERVEDLGEVDDVDLSRMDALDTTVLFQEVDTAAVRDALEGNSGIVEDTNYLGQEVYSVYAPAEFGSVGWVLVAEAERSEVDEPLVAFVRDSLVVTAVFVVIITFVAVAWANRFVSPLQIISAALAKIRDGDDDVSVPATGAREFRALANALDHMVGELDRRREEVTEALAAKVDVLRTLLPPAAAERVGRGDRRLVETVPQATAVVIIIEGLDDAFKGGDAGGNRDFVHAMVDEVDSLAVINGLERVKLSGDVYYAVCGLSTPYVDHAPRSVAFALSARNTVRRVADENDLGLDIAAGINSGPITTGLVGGSRLVYDLWGDTVEDAYVVARAARAGDVVVTKAVRDRTPAGRAMESVELVPGMETWIVHLEARGGDDE